MYRTAHRYFVMHLSRCHPRPSSRGGPILYSEKGPCLLFEYIRNIVVSIPLPDAQVVV